MQRFISPVLLSGAVVALISATLIDWRSTLLAGFRPGIPTLLILVATGALWLECRLYSAGAWMERSRFRLVVASIVLVFTFSKGCFQLRDVRDLLLMMPSSNWWQKEQMERDIDVVEACAVRRRAARTLPLARLKRSGSMRTAREEA
jgi:hypothetical protein